MSFVFTPEFPAFQFAEVNKTPISIANYSAIINAGTTNGVAVAGVAGKAIRVLCVVAKCTTGTAVNAVLLKSGSGGTSLLQFDAPKVGDPTLVMATNLHGWCDTASGAGLYVDTGSAGNVALSFRYIFFTPVS